MSLASPPATTCTASPGFDGVAPGARLIGLKIADDAHGTVSTTGSMLHALDYAIRFARDRAMPLVVNLSFGVGNEIEGTARIDHLIDSVLAAHPDVVMTVAAGNDGPGLSTIGFPASASRVDCGGRDTSIGIRWRDRDDTAPEPCRTILQSRRGGGWTGHRGAGCRVFDSAQLCRRPGAWKPVPAWRRRTPRGWWRA